MIGTADSGTTDAPLIIRGAPDGTTFSGAIDLPTHPATAEDLADAEIAGAPAHSILVADEITKSLHQPPAIVRRGFRPHMQTSQFLLFQGERRLEPARWPKRGFLEEARQAAVAGQGKQPAKGQPTVRIELPRPPTSTLQGDPDLWFGGFWNADWDYETNRALTFDDAGTAVGFRPSPAKKVRAKVRLFAFNVASALSLPGEYVLQAEHDRALIMPVSSDTPVELAVADNLLRIDGAHDVRLERVAFEKSLGDTVEVAGSSDIALEDCFVGRSGRRAIAVDGGARVAIRRCIVTDSSESAVSLSGGDRQTLTPSRHELADSVVTAFGLEAWTYRPGVDLRGVGQRVTGSYVADGAHAGIVLKGNDHWITGSEFAGLLTQTDDAGAIYMGRDWTARGQLIMGNYFHDLGGPAVAEKRYVAGVYLDDQFSGTTIKANVFADVPIAVMIGGGRDNLLADNLFIDPARGAVFLDNRGRTWQKNSKTFTDRMAAVPVESATYKARYPQLAVLMEDKPGAPQGNRLLDNITVGGKEFFLKGVKASAFAENQAGSPPTKQVAAALRRADDRRQIEAALQDDPALAKLKVPDHAALIEGLLFKARLADPAPLPWSTQ